MTLSANFNEEQILTIFLEGAIDYLKENYGDIPGYVKTELGLTDTDIVKLQTLYTQKRSLK